MLLVFINKNGFKLLFHLRYGKNHRLYCRAPNAPKIQGIQRPTKKLELILTSKFLIHFTCTASLNHISPREWLLTLASLGPFPSNTLLCQRCLSALAVPIALARAWVLVSPGKKTNPFKLFTSMLFWYTHFMLKYLSVRALMTMVRNNIL